MALTFEQTFGAAIGLFSSWDLNVTLQEVTIIRDVNGRLSFLIDASGAVKDADLNNLKSILRNGLGNYFQGNVYVKQNRNNDLIEMVILEVERLRWKYRQQDHVNWYVLERAIAKKAWVELNNSEEAVWPFEAAQKSERPKVITFYSFKGGMGRTTALAAVALCLAKQGKNVLAIDTDIEAPGLATLFLNEGDVQKGTVDYMLEAAVFPEGESIDMSEMISPITDPALLENISGKLFVIPAGTVDDEYLQKLARIDFQDTVPGNMKKQITRLINEAVDTIGQVCRVDYVLLDSRAGFHDMGGVVTAQIPHGVVLFGKDSRQSWLGMEMVLKSISFSQKEKPFVAIVDSTCGSTGVITTEEKNSFTSQSYVTCCESYYSENEEQPGPEALGEAHSPIFVPFAPALANNIQLYTDGSETKDNELRQIKQLLQNECYQQISQRIQRWFDAEEGA